MKTRNKKGFTIVELVIVIAVIGILTAILVPVFINLTNKANRASDDSLVKNLNTAMAMEEGEGKSNNTYNDAIQYLDNYGFKLENLATKSEYSLLWNSKTNRFLLNEESEYVADKAATGAKDVDYWTIKDNIPEGNKFSIYAGLGWDDAAAVELTGIGFDAGNHTITSISYNGASQNVVIRTNGGSLTVDAANDTVSHYGYVEVLDVQAVDTIHSYHENGTAGFARLKQGHFVVESEGIVNVLYATGSKTAVKVDNNNGTIGKAYATVTETANIYNGDAQEGQSGNVTLEKYDAVITEAVVTAMNSESIVEELNKTESSAVKTAIEAAVESSTFRGEGTEESPYLISNANELIIFRNKINTVSTNDPILTSYFKLTNDVDISTESNWRPISETGTSGKTFSGHFDGNNKTISGLRITEGSYRGLFGYVSGATIENVKLVNAQVNGAERIGALVGKIQGSATIKNCSTDSQSSVIGNNSNTGGLIGEIATNGIVVNLISLNNNAKVENTKSDSSRAGGIVGQVTTGADVTITGCENHGKITTNNGYAGGIVSAYQSGSLTITNCANNGELSGDYTGNMLGWYTSVRSITISSETNEFDLNAIGRFDIATSSNVSLYGKTYFVNKRSEYNKYKGSVLSSDEQRFSDIFAPEIIGQSPVALWDRLIHFYKTAKQTNNAFNVYPENYWGVFDEEYVGFGEGWDQYLTQYNEAYPDATLTKDEFSSSSWRQNIVYLAPTAEGPAE